MNGSLSLLGRMQQIWFAAQICRNRYPNHPTSLFWNRPILQLNLRFHPILWASTLSWGRITKPYIQRCTAWSCHTSRRAFWSWSGSWLSQVPKSFQEGEEVLVSGLVMIHPGWAPMSTAHGLGCRHHQLEKWKINYTVTWDRQARECRLSVTRSTGKNLSLTSFLRV